MADEDDVDLQAAIAMSLASSTGDSSTPNVVSQDGGSTGTVPAPSTPSPSVLPGAPTETGKTIPTDKQASPSAAPSIHLSSLPLLKLGEMKVVMLVRTDLKMGVGKMCAQCGHAALGIYRVMYHSSNRTWKTILREWEMIGEAKIALKCPSEDEMATLSAKADQAGFPTYTVHDAGRTQIAAGSATVCAIAGPKMILDTITGHLKLL
eukprot:TRINITY_DN7289_c0_g1_i1.p1 TRINITY_DN7289_c0_g1~~TRINITY_DN7289_c0_g1_i1.p1  ORF type:complete len:207 (-),score=28.37 TRINITY_DN7289_c0_g1_i1:51-671(-)